MSSPATILHGCYFHFTQAIKRKIQFLGLVQQCKDNNEVVAVCRQLMALPFIPVADENQAYTFIDQVRVLVAEMKCAELLPRPLLLCSVPLVRKCTALELFRAEIIARKCTVRISIVRTYPGRLLVSADAGSRNSTMRKWGCGAGGKPS